MKLVKEHINEKFTEDSDPISDMEIGIITQLKKEYIEKYPWVASRKDSKDIKLSELMYFCIDHRNYNLDVIKALINAGVDINDKEYNFLAHSVDYRDINFIKFLLDNGAKANADRSLALKTAISKKKFDIAELLIKKGASIKVAGTEQLIQAVKYNDTTLIKWLLDKGINPNVYNYKALRYALKNQNYEISDLFVKAYIKDRGLK